jgi:DNA-binding XRE family transcriptional regulator
MKDELFQELLASVKQGAAIMNGTLQPSRSFEFPGIVGSITADEYFTKYFPGETKEAVALRGARGREDLTQKQLSEMTGIPQRHLSEMENGRRTIGKERAKKLAAALHCDYRLFL